MLGRKQIFFLTQLSQENVSLKIISFIVLTIVKEFKGLEEF